MNTSQNHFLQIGTVLNQKWVVLEFLGKGAMGEVYRAHQLNLKRDTAIKVVSREWLASCEDDEEEIRATFQRFEREVEAMAAIRHPNVLQILDYDSTTVRKGDSDVAIDYIAMEYVPGNTLRSTMLEDGFYPDEEATKGWLIDYFLPILLGVKAIHGVGIVHRDLKPENILLDGDKPKIADFGLARSHRLRSITQSADSKGTPPYMAPEQFMDFKRTGKRADIYSLGKILYEAIEGKMTPKTVLPFQCVRLKKTNTLFFEKLDQLVCDATAEDKEERIESVEQFRVAVIEAIDTLSTGKRPRASEHPRQAPGLSVRAGLKGAGPLPGRGETAARDPSTGRWEPAPQIAQGHGRRTLKYLGRGLGATGLLVLIASAVLIWNNALDDSSPSRDRLSVGGIVALAPSDTLSRNGPHENAPGPDSDLQPIAPEIHHTPEHPDSRAELEHVPSPDDYAADVEDPFPVVHTDLPIVEGKNVPSPETLEMRKGKMQDMAGGVPDEILALQSLARVNPPSMKAATATALGAAEEAAERLIDRDYHKGTKRIVPDQFEHIQSAIDASKPGDWVLVKEGRYFESIVLRNGVKLLSDASGGGDKAAAIEGGQSLLPVRALQTVIDGSKAKGSAYWILSFEAGAGPNTIVDGFTIEHLPVQDHHILASSYAINVNGASPVIMNCFIRKNGSMGIGNHVSYEHDMRKGKPKRHFEARDVKTKAEPVIYRNVICQNLGLGILCDHFSAPHLLGNEVFLNVFPYRAEYGEKASPGIEAKHGSRPKVIGNIVHDHPGAGIVFDACMPEPLDQDRHRSLPSVIKNLVYSNGENGVSILCGGGPAAIPVECVGNLVYEAGWVGIDLSKGAMCVVEDNVVCNAGAPGIRIDGASVVRLNRNSVSGANGPGFIIKNGGNVSEMVANISDLNKGPRFVLRKGRIGGLDG